MFYIAGRGKMVYLVPSISIGEECMLRRGGVGGGGGWSQGCKPEWLDRSPSSEEPCFSGSATPALLLGRAEPENQPEGPEGCASVGDRKRSSSGA